MDLHSRVYAQQRTKVTAASLPYRERAKRNWVVTAIPGNAQRVAAAVKIRSDVAVGIGRGILALLHAVDEYAKCRFGHH